MLFAKGNEFIKISTKERVIMIYRTEHPKPQFMRENWLNLNGEWQFEIDGGNSGKERKIYKNDIVFSQKINVPFCPESKLSGIENVDFMQSVWYKRSFNIEKEQLNGRIILHFGAVDYFATVYINGEECGTHKGGYVSFSFDITEYVNSEKHLWEVGNGRLYDLVLTYGEDTVKSYFGLRSVKIEGNKFLINGKSVFQRLILDQGFYPDGIYTAPSDNELIADIERSLAMGFNGARLHEKVFEERFLYHCDRLGYIVWGEYPNWGLDHSYADSIYGILPEWLEEVDRDFNHPAIIGWCPFNETWDKNGRKQFDPLLSTVYKATKSADPTRPCIDTSGNFHVLTDVYDLHDYEQNPVEFKKHYEPLGKTNELEFGTAFKDRQHYDGKMPFFVSEYGGIGWNVENGWGYGKAPKTEEEFLQRLEGLTDVLLENKNIFGLCYTQLTDVEQEQNGLYTYDRRPKFPPEKIHKIFSKKAAIED